MWGFFNRGDFDLQTLARVEKAKKIDLAVVKKYLKRGATMTSVGEGRDVTAGAIRYRIVRFIERNKKNPLAKEALAKIANNRRG